MKGKAEYHMCPIPFRLCDTNFGTGTLPFYEEIKMGGFQIEKSGESSLPPLKHSQFADSPLVFPSPLRTTSKSWKMRKLKICDCC